MKLYKNYEEGNLISCEYCIITKKENYTLVSEYAIFKSGNKCLLDRFKESVWAYNDCINWKLQQGFQPDIAK